MLADGPDAKPEGRPEHDDVREQDDGEGDPDHQVQLTDRVVQEMPEAFWRDSAQVQMNVGDLRDRAGRALIPVDLDEQVARDPDREEVDGRPDDDLVDAE